MKVEGSLRSSKNYKLQVAYLLHLILFSGADSLHLIVFSGAAT